MVTQDDVPHERRLSGPITVTVDEVRTNPKQRRDTELAVRDEDGAELSVVIWETHEIDQPWQEGITYELSGARGKRYATQSGTDVELHSTKVFSARRVTTNDATRVLVLGDTHVGYRHRPSSDKPGRGVSMPVRYSFDALSRRMNLTSTPSSTQATCSTTGTLREIETQSDKRSRELSKRESHSTTSSGITTTRRVESC